MYSILPGLLTDLPELAACQCACFPDSFGTRIGKKYIAKSLEWFLAGENRFLFCIRDKRQIVGYCGGFVPQFRGDGSTSGMMHFGMTEAFIGMIAKPWLFFSKEIRQFYPLIFKNVLSKLIGSKATESEIDEIRPVPEKRCGLVVIGVHPNYRGGGYFQSLMQEFERQALARGIHHLVLSVKPSNARAINAYRKCGWQINRQDDKMVEMGKEV